MFLYTVVELGNYLFRLYLEPKLTEEDPTVVAVVQHELKVKFKAVLYPQNFVPDPLSFFEKVLDSSTNRDFSMKYKFLSENDEQSTNYTTNHEQLHLTFSDIHKIELQAADYDEERELMIEKVIQMHKKPRDFLANNLNVGRLNKLIEELKELQQTVDRQGKDNVDLSDEIGRHKAEIERHKTEFEKFKTEIEKLKKEPENNVNYNGFSGTTILTYGQITTLKQWTGGANWQLIYRGSSHGWTASNFHSYCNNKDQTLVVVKSNDGYVFGGYCPVSWTSSNSYINASTAWLFSLKSPNGESHVKLPATQNFENCIYDHSSYGPRFGSNPDLYISNSPTSNSNSSNLGGSYSNNSYGRQYFTSSQNFTVSEIEVFAIK